MGCASSKADDAGGSGPPRAAAAGPAAAAPAAASSAAGAAPPVPSPARGAPPQPAPPAPSQAQVSQRVWPGAAPDSSLRGAAATPTTREVARLTKARQVLGKLAALVGGANTVPGSFELCAAAAGLLQSNMAADGVDFASLTACVPKARGQYILVGAAGAGADEAARAPVLCSSGCAAALLCSQQDDGDGGRRRSSPGNSTTLCLSVGAGGDVTGLPEDWRALHQSAGLHSFLAGHVWSRGACVGILTLGSMRPKAFKHEGWDQQLGLLCAGVALLLSHPLLGRLCQLMVVTDACGHDFAALMAALLQDAESLLLSYTGSNLGVRLVLLPAGAAEAAVCWHELDDDAGEGQAQPPRAAAAQALSRQSSPGRSEHGGSVWAAPEPARLELRMVPAEQTALAKGPTCQREHTATGVSGLCMRELVDEPALDAAVSVGQADRPPSSALVALLPPQRGRGYQAALYVTARRPPGMAAAAPSTFTVEARNNIAALAGAVQLLLARVTDDALAQALQRQLLRQQERQTEQAATVVPRPGTPPSADGQATAAWCAAAADSAEGIGAPYLRSSSLSKAVEAHVRKSYELRGTWQGDEGCLEDLRLQRLLGKGGFGAVYKGLWQGKPVAVKVMTVPDGAQQVLKAATEVALNSTLNHPNLVSVYKSMTDMVQVMADEGGQRFRPLTQDDPTDTPTCHLLIMEYCDRGNLWHCLRQGLVHRVAANGQLLIDMHVLLTVLVEVACSLHYLHSSGVLHCDLKPENVMLVTDPSAPLGFSCKLGDFGLSRVLADGQLYMRNRSTSGTITHISPERFELEARVDAKTDVYAFAMLMYEVYTGARPFFKELPATIVQKVMDRQRPVFPVTTPPQFRALAEACWSHEASERPSFDAVLKQLMDMQAQLARATAEARASAAAAASASGAAAAARLAPVAAPLAAAAPAAAVAQLQAATGAPAGAGGGAALPANAAQQLQAQLQAQLAAQLQGTAVVLTPEAQYDMLLRQVEQQVQLLLQQKELVRQQRLQRELALAQQAQVQTLGQDQGPQQARASQQQ